MSSRRLKNGRPLGRAARWLRRHTAVGKALGVQEGMSQDEAVRYLAGHFIACKIFKKLRASSAFHRTGIVLRKGV